MKQYLIALAALPGPASAQPPSQRQRMKDVRRMARLPRMGGADLVARNDRRRGSRDAAADEKLRVPADERPAPGKVSQA